MGLDTKGVMVGSFKDPIALLTVIEGALSQVVRSSRRQSAGAGLSAMKSREDFKPVSVRLFPSSSVAHLTFVCAGESRQMAVFFDHDCDHEDLGAKSVSLALGCWGNSVHYMAVALHAMSLFAPVFLDENDCDSIGMAPLGVEQPSLLQALNLGYLSPYTFEKLASKFNEFLRLGLQRTYDDFVGMSRERLAEFQKETDVSKRWDAIVLYSRELPLAVLPYPRQLALDF